MDITLVLLAASALIGAIAGLQLKALALAPIGISIALVSATVVRMHGFRLGNGVAIVFGCLFLNQTAYVLAHVFSLAPNGADRSLDDIADGEPGRDRKQTVDGNDGDQKPPPSGPLFFPPKH